MKLFKSLKSDRPAPRPELPGLAELRERYREAKNHYDATRGGERHSFTKEQQAQAKLHYERCLKAVDAGIAADRKARKSGKANAVPATAMPAANATASGSSTAAQQSRIAQPDPRGSGNVAGFGTRYQDFPVFRGPETGPFLDGRGRWE